MKKYQITFLLDETNNWLAPFVSELAKCIDKKRYISTISYDYQKIIDQDIVFILGYTKILNDKFLLNNKLNLVVHESDLPDGKGFAPVQWQILEGKNNIPITLFEASSSVDSGDIVSKSVIELNGLELYEEIRVKQANATTSLILDFLIKFPKFTRIKQLISHKKYPRRTTKDGELDVDKTIREQFNLLRIGNNDLWPSYFFIEGKKYVIKIFDT